MAWNNYQNLYFTTATILEWKHLLKNDRCKEIVVESLRFLRDNDRAYIHGFVIMPNHIHLVWSIPGKNELSVVKASLLSRTAHEFKKHLKQNHPQVLERFRAKLKDRGYQFWERNAFSFPIYHDKVFYQKLNYTTKTRAPKNGGWLIHPNRTNTALLLWVIHRVFGLLSLREFEQLFVDLNMGLLLARTPNNGQFWLGKE